MDINTISLSMRHYMTDVQYVVLITQSSELILIFCIHCIKFTMSSSKPTFNEPIIQNSLHYEIGASRRHRQGDSYLTIRSWAHQLAVNTCPQLHLRQAKKAQRGSRGIALLLPYSQCNKIIKHLKTFMLVFCIFCDLRR